MRRNKEDRDFFPSETWSFSHCLCPRGLPAARPKGFSPMILWLFWLPLDPYVFTGKCPVLFSFSKWHDTSWKERSRVENLKCYCSWLLIGVKAFSRGHYLFIPLILIWGKKILIGIILSINHCNLGKSLHDPLWEIVTFNELGQLHFSLFKTRNPDHSHPDLPPWITHSLIPVAKSQKLTLKSHPSPFDHWPTFIKALPKVRAVPGLKSLII